MENVKFSYRVFDNCLEIIPNGGIKDNSTYEIRIKQLKSVDGKTIGNLNIKTTTAMTPCYCSVESIQILLDAFELSVSDILFYIRQASRQADHINGGPPELVNGKVPYVIEKYVEIKATLDTLTKAYITGSYDSGMEGTLGQLTFKNGSNLDNMKLLMGDLKAEVKVWQDAIRGYEFEGRNKMSFGRRADKTVWPTPAYKILNNYTRNVNMGRGI